MAARPADGAVPGRSLPGHARPPRRGSDRLGLEAGELQHVLLLLRRDRGHRHAGRGRRVLVAGRALARRAAPALGPRSRGGVPPPARARSRDRAHPPAGPAAGLGADPRRRPRRHRGAAGRREAGLRVPGVRGDLVRQLEAPRHRRAHGPPDRADVLRGRRERAAPRGAGLAPDGGRRVRLRSAGERSIPTPRPGPSPAAVTAFLRAHGIDYIYADAAHPNTLAPDAEPVASSGGFELLRLP